jgi:hypothetical protein
LLYVPHFYMVPLYWFSMFPRPLHHLSEQQNAATTAALLARLAGSGVRPPHPLWGKLPLLPHSLPQLLGLPPFPPHHHPAHHHHQHHHQNQFSPPPHQQHHSFLQGGFHSNSSRGDGADSPIDGTYFSLLILCSYFIFLLFFLSLFLHLSIHSLIFNIKFISFLYFFSSLPLMFSYSSLCILSLFFFSHFQVISLFSIFFVERKSFFFVADRNRTRLAFIPHLFLCISFIRYKQF